MRKGKERAEIRIHIDSAHLISPVQGNTLFYVDVVVLVQVVPHPQLLRRQASSGKEISSRYSLSRAFSSLTE